jgi:hypothetical protein
LKTPLFPIAAAAALLAIAVFASSAAAQTPQAPSGQQSAPGAQPWASMPHPAPTNLKVLPKNLTGDEVHEIMMKWAGSLGVHCNTCHAADPTKLGPDGRPQLNFPDDSKDEKAAARLMYTMTLEINKNYISKIENAEKPVECGTCHRGHLDPEEFIIPPPPGHGPPNPAGGPSPAVPAPAQQH